MAACFSQIMCDLLFCPEAFWTTEEKPIYRKCHTNMEPYQYGENLSLTIEGFLSAEIKSGQQSIS